MKITVLTAAETAAKEIKTDKGQSFFIAAGDRNLVYGFSSGKKALQNMEKLGIKSYAADSLFLPCGNRENVGGIRYFMAADRRAAMYARVNAFDPHFKKGKFGMKEVTPDKKLKDAYNMHLCKDFFVEKEGGFAVFSLSDSQGDKRKRPRAAEDYFVRDEQKKYVPDDFSHELYLLVSEGKKWVLILGDVHTDAAKAIARAQALVRNKLGGTLTAAVGSFNLVYRGKTEPDEKTDLLTEALYRSGLQIYTGHTTGEYAFEQMQKTLGEKIRYYAAGDVLEL